MPWAKACQRSGKIMVVMCRSRVGVQGGAVQGQGEAAGRVAVAQVAAGAEYAAVELERVEAGDDCPQRVGAVGGGGTADASGSVFEGEPYPQAVRGVQR